MTIASTQVLTPSDVANQVNANGLDVLGLTVPMLSMTWSSTTPGAGAVDDNTLRMTLANIRAPFTGTYELVAAATRWSGPSGDPISTSAGVLALHPEALHRLESLVRARLGSLNRPIPAAMLVHGVSLPAQPLMAWFRAGDVMPDSGDVTFHDRRGLVIDPIAVAALFADLIGWRNALTPAAFNAGTVAGGGGVGAIAGLAGTVPLRVHVVTPHGAAYRSRRTGSEMQVLDGGGAVVSTVPSSGLIDLAAGQQIGHPVSGPAVPQVLWGSGPGGTLDTVAWTAPPLPSGGGAPVLARQFFRVVAVDLDWHLLGNRSYAPGDATVPAEDDMPTNAPLPVVRRSVPGFSFLLDGSEVMGALGAALNSWPSAADRIGLLCSPQIDSTLALPAGSGSAVHWPGTPGTPVSPAGATAAMLAYDPTVPATAPIASWATPASGDPRDVIVTFPSGALPVGIHVRVYSRQFQVIRAIGEDPSFLRGDGGAAIVQSAGATSLRLINAFGLGPADPLPSPAVLSVDFVMVAQDGTRRMASTIHLPVGAPQPWVDNTATFGGLASPIVTALIAAAGFTSIAPSSTFGIPQTTPTLSAPAVGASVATWVRWLANEGGWPRIGPHLPSQTRFETVLALGAVTTPGAPYTFDAVVSGSRYAWESRCSSPELGNPGNPAGPDVHATGVRVGGQLAYDLAFHALKRCQSIVPTGAGAPGWFVQTMGDNWDVPPPDPEPAPGAPYMAGAMLETISAITDSPELSLLQVPAETATVQSLVDDAVAAFGLAPGSMSVTVNNEQRLRRQVQREIATAARGQRDAMWSLARAIAEAREYVFIESPMFARTAATGDQHLVDLVDLLVTRLGANPRLKVMISLPRLPDFNPTNAPFVRGAFRDRKAALQTLQSAAQERVAAFHPIGFPGRSVVGRSTVVLVDDAYALVGTSHWRRRGMTFDGGCDIVSLDRRLDDRGASATVAGFRQALMAARLGIAQPPNAASSTALWTRLAEPESAFDLVRDLLASGGLGRCTPVHAGPTDTSVIPEDTDKIDPNGLAGTSLPVLLGGLIP